MGKKNKKRNLGWTPPMGAGAYFSAASDEEFKRKHPIGYPLLVMLGITALMLPVALYLFFVIPYNVNSPWLILGWIGGFIVGIGLFNLVAIVIRQYLGHIVSILSFVIGGVLIWISLAQMGIL